MPVEHGFALYVRGEQQHDIEAPSVEPRGLLSCRQQFTVAHEIAHTFFYDLSLEQPAPHPVGPNALALEEICDQAAGCLLMPTQLLKRTLPDAEDMNISFVRELASLFDVSLTVALRALGQMSALSPTARAILLAHRMVDDAQIVAFCFGTGLLRTLPRPARFTRLRDWLPGIPRRVVAQRRDNEWEATSAGRTVLFRKVEVGSGPTFLLQVEEVDERPAGKCQARDGA